MIYPLNKLQCQSYNDIYQVSQATCITGQLDSVQYPSSKYYGDVLMISLLYNFCKIILFIIVNSLFSIMVTLGYHQIEDHRVYF